MARADAGSVWRPRAPQPRLLKDPGCLAQVLLIAPHIVCGGTMLVKRSSSRNSCRNYPKFIPMSNSKSHATRSAELRKRVGHPIIDSDGHVVEFEPALLDYIREAGGSAMLERYKTAPDTAFSFAGITPRPPSGASFAFSVRYGGPTRPKTHTTVRPRHCLNCSTSGSTIRSS